uniref:Shell matrix protein n=1 Tax=Laqueus rubellus TaxID=93892 RepID=A0A3G9CNK6_LAQRU
MVSTVNHQRFRVRFQISGPCPAQMPRQGDFFLSGNVVIDPLDLTKSYALTTGCNKVVEWENSVGLNRDVRDFLYNGGCRLGYDVILGPR